MKIQEINVKIQMPENLDKLMKIANNLWWSFNDNAKNLFKMINPIIWEESNHNPFEILSTLTKKDLENLSEDRIFMSLLDDVWNELQSYLKMPKWFEINYENKINESFRVAYFSAEYGLHESIRLYSGGLGILSGDHCKSASDLGIPFVAVGLLYRNGYFTQYLNSDGWQQEKLPFNEFCNMPIEEAIDNNGNPIIFKIQSPDGDINVKVWILNIGINKIIFLDTDIELNSDLNRQITSQLYGGDNLTRIRQEIVLGIGGIKALNALGIKPSVFHINEGHPAFLCFERLQNLIKEGLAFETAIEIVKKTTLFTTHTPVPAGFDLFDNDIFMKYIGPIYSELLDMKQLISLGKVNPQNQSEAFSMAVLGMKMSTFRNGVSKLHGQVSRNMFKELWPNTIVKCIPIEHVTNGIHLSTWISQDMKRLYKRYFGTQRTEKPYKFNIWNNIDNVPDLELFETKQIMKTKLIAYTREKLKKQIKERGGSYSELREAETVLNSDALTIGFARRFATYKRGYMIFTDEDRLAEILNNPEYPVQIIFAGKAHPRDNEGKEIIKKIFHISRKPEFKGKIVFLENYDMGIAKELVAGVDIWLNNPRKPMEASGTSGMKVAANGGLNLSVLDGWWDEGYNGHNGWSIGAGEIYKDENYQNFVESQELYDKLENEIVPMFFHRDKSGIPREWVKMMKNSIKTIPSYFNTSRMLMEYTDKFYLPLHELYEDIFRNNFEEIKNFMVWKREIKSKWNNLHFIYAGIESSNLKTGDKAKFFAELSLGDININDINVFVVVEFGKNSSLNEKPDFLKMNVEEINGNKVKLKKEIILERSGKLRFSFVVLPSHKFVQRDFESDLAKWY
jgi:starch phosphorylase